MSVPQPARDEFIARYSVVKHNWKGKYTRIFCVGKNCVATIDPTSIFKVTNIWDYPKVVDCLAAGKAPTDFTLTFRNGKNTDSTTFSCMTALERSELLSDVQQFRNRFDASWQPTIDRQVFPARKYKSNEEWAGTLLQVTNTGILQRNTDGAIIGKYLYIHIKAIGALDEGGDTATPSSSQVGKLVIKYGRTNKLHMYQTEHLDMIIRLAQELAGKYIGLNQLDKLPPMRMHDFDTNRLGVGRTELASHAEFPVMKIAARHNHTPIRRIFSTTAKQIVERDPATYNAVSAYNLEDVCAVVRCEDDPQKFQIEYKDPHIIKTYISSSRDALLAHVVDACRAINHGNVGVLTKTMDRGKRVGPIRTFVSEDIESTLLRCLIDPAKGGGVTPLPFNEIVEYFNANVEYSGLRFTENKEGLFAENREKLIFAAVTALFDNFPKAENPELLVNQFYALRRLCVTRTGFSSVAVVPTLVKAIESSSQRALKLHHTAVSHAVMDFLNAIASPHHENYEPYHEQINKHRLLSNDTFVRHLLQLLRTHIEQDSGALVIQALLDFLVVALCPPYSDTTDTETFSFLLAAVVGVVGKTLFYLLQHPAKAIRHSTGLVIRVILEEGSEDQFYSMQRASMTEGGFLRMFSVASYSTDRQLRDLARRLIALFSFDHQNAQDLLRRMIPVTMLHFLQSKEEPPSDEQHEEFVLGVTQATAAFFETKKGWNKKRFNPREAALGKATAQELAYEQVVLRQRIVHVKPTLNWAMFFYQVKKDHYRPDLIWNHNTRTELREALDAEMQAFQLGLELRKERAVCWNYQEFEVQFPSLQSELRIGNHYPRLLFETQHPVIARPKEFFNDMYHRFLLIQDFELKCQCLHGMAILYQHYAEEIGQFNDIEFMVQMLDHATHPRFRDRMLLFLSHLLRARLNVKPFIDCNGVKPLVDLLPLAHLHIDRPQIHVNTMAIESNTNAVDLQDQEKEWHYVNAAGEKMEPISFAEMKRRVKDGSLKPTTRVWAQGLGGWKEIQHVPQLRWGCLNEGERGVMSLTEVSCTVLDILTLLCAYYPTRDEDGSIMQPLPRVKRFLSDPGVLPHIVQLLLTFDPSICSRVCGLVYLLMEDNPLMPRLFLTGFFFFALMYTGSDIVPLCRVLNLAHRKQSFRTESDNEIIRSSVLAPLLPPAMVCVLANHGPGKFAEIFLGEYETPEAIWGKEMRRYLVEKIAAHISDFTPRLMGNIRAQYSYCPIVGVEYAQLRNELFCSQYYLRHLCDEIKYPVWPVSDPVALMRDVLTTWKLELEKEPTTMSREKCFETLQLQDIQGDPTQQQIRKAYFKLAAIYHPDKNPNGREMFEAIQKAYEFLASNAEASDQPDAKKVYLLLKAQSILFSRFPQVMSTYKYAGYSLLLKLVQMEFADEQMLTKEVCLMDPAVELCYYTVDNNALNADELLVEGGIDLISSVMNRCIDLVTASSTDAQVHTRIVGNAIRTFTVAATYRDCLDRIMTMPTIPVHASRAIAFSKAVSLSRAGIECCRSFCAHEQLQESIVQAGTIWHLLLYIFRFDYTLEESGVAINEENHTQLYANKAARTALRCICALVGFRPNEDDIASQFHPQMYALLCKLLTHFICTKLRTEPACENAVLKYLNSNHETPYFLWNNTSRAELRDFLRKNSDQARDNAGGYGEMPNLDVERFEYSAHAKELVVGGVFVRIYNQQPQFQITDPAGFMQSLFDYTQLLATVNLTAQGDDVDIEEELVVDEVEEGQETSAETTSATVSTVATESKSPLPGSPRSIDASMAKTLKQLSTLDEATRNAHLTMCLEAMSNVLTAYPTVAPVCAHNMSANFKILETRDEAVIANAFQFFSKCCGSIECIQTIGMIPTAISTIILAMQRGTAVHQAALAFIHQLMSDRDCVLQALDHGLYIELLAIFTTARVVAVKEEACVCLAKCCQNSLSGPKIMLRCQKLIPAVFLETMKENPQQVCQLFETWQENPELVWNAQAKSRACNKIANAHANLVEVLSNDRNMPWKVPEEITQDALEEYQVGGVFLALFVKQPNWGVRKPREFLQQLLEAFTTESARDPVDSERMGLIADSLVAFLSGQPAVADYIVASGYIPRVFGLIVSHAEITRVAAIRICHEIANSRACVESMNSFDPVAPLMRSIPDVESMLGVIMDTLERLMARSSEKANMIRYAMQNDVVQTLLKMLDGGLQQSGQQHLASAKAIIIKVLKTMMRANDKEYGGEVNHLLNESSVWWKYKDQNHDLFLTSAAFGGFLTGPAQGPTLALAAPPTRHMDDAPPPMD
jgi:DnaJ family protein C protein 13